MVLWCYVMYGIALWTKDISINKSNVTNNKYIPCHWSIEISYGRIHVSIMELDRSRQGYSIIIQLPFDIVTIQNLVYININSTALAFQIDPFKYTYYWLIYMKGDTVNIHVCLQCNYNCWRGRQFCILTMLPDVPQMKLDSIFQCLKVIKKSQIILNLHHFGSYATFWS